MKSKMEIDYQKLKKIQKSLMRIDEGVDCEINNADEVLLKIEQL